MRTGNFEDYIYLEDDTELEVNVQWEGVNDRGDRWTPPYNEMTIDVELVGDWPEGLSKEEFNAAVKSAEYRFIDRAWEDFRDAA